MLLVIEHMVLEDLKRNFPLLYFTKEKKLCQLLGVATPQLRECLKGFDGHAER